MNYTIKEAAKIVNLNATTLRYYDKEGLLPFVSRSESGIRLFKDSDFEWLRLIEYLKATGLSIREIKQFIDLYNEGDSTIKQRRDMFYERKVEIEKHLLEVQNMLDIVNYKCWFYDQALKDGTSDNVKKIEVSDLPDKIKKGKLKLSKFHCE